MSKKTNRRKARSEREAESLNEEAKQVESEEELGKEEFGRENP
jgi:hypothetical protein